MSLKTFHIAFITLSALLAFWFAVWAIYQHVQDARVEMLVAGVVSFVCGIGLIAYGVRFLRKLKHVSFL